MTVRKSSLRAVGSDEVPESAHVKTVVEAAKTGTTRELLAATRDRIAVAVENPNTAARDLASLTKRLMETVREIEALDARDEQEAGESVEVSDGEFNASAV
tara:strand:+ start:684 stop:986 length:303 start_codon:yes stop_codon:yes gene_type:complete